jgi:hypothetical protein
MNGRLLAASLAAAAAVAMFGVAAAVAPANDEQNTARELTKWQACDGGSASCARVTADTSDANDTAGEPEPTCVPFGSHTVWYKLTPPQTGYLSLETERSDYDTVLQVYRQKPGGPLLPVSCDDDGGPGLASLIEGLPVQAGFTYYVLVTSYAGEPGGNLHMALHFSTAAPY